MWFFLLHQKREKKSSIIILYLWISWYYKSLNTKTVSYRRQYYKYIFFVKECVQKMFLFLSGLKTVKKIYIYVKPSGFFFFNNALVYLLSLTIWVCKIIKSIFVIVQVLLLTTLFLKYNTFSLIKNKSNENMRITQNKQGDKLFYTQGGGKKMVIKFSTIRQTFEAMYTGTPPLLHSTPPHTPSSVILLLCPTSPFLPSFLIPVFPTVYGCVFTTYEHLFFLSLSF